MSGVPTPGQGYVDRALAVVNDTKVGDDARVIVLALLAVRASLETLARVIEEK